MVLKQNSSGSLNLALLLVAKFTSMRKEVVPSRALVWSRQTITAVTLSFLIRNSSMREPSILRSRAACSEMPDELKSEIKKIIKSKGDFAELVQKLRR
jgi:hypothetical protein